MTGFCFTPDLLVKFEAFRLSLKQVRTVFLYSFNAFIPDKSGYNPTIDPSAGKAKDWKNRTFKTPDGKEVIL